MLVRSLVVLICLAGFQTVCQATDPEFDSAKQFKVDSVQLTESETLQFGPFSLLGQDVSVGLKYPNRKVILVIGNARLVCGQTRFSADKIEVSYKTPLDLRVELTGNIEIENERDQLRMFARSALLKTNPFGRLIILGGRERESVTFVRTSNNKTTEIQAQQIQVLLSDAHTLKIVAIENAKIRKRRAHTTDLVKVENSTPSELDFFNGISITDCQITTKDNLRQSRKRETEVEKLQLLNQLLK